MEQLRVAGPDSEWPLDALIDNARTAERTGAWDDALAGYRTALGRIDAGEEVERGPAVLRWTGRVLFERGDYDQAHSVLEASLFRAQDLGRREDAAGALNSLAVVEQFRGRLDVAEALYGRACALADEVGDLQLAAMIDQNLGTLANVRGDLGTALVRYQAALERFRQLEDDRASAWVLNNMGMLNVDVGDWAAAELSFNAAYNLAERVGDDSTVGKIEGNRAELYLKRQNYEAARECCERAFRIFSKLGSHAGLGEVHKFYGMLYRETGNWEIAHLQLNLALRLAQTCENPLLEAETESERAVLFVLERQPHLAVQSLNRAHRIFCELDARREILDLRRRRERLESVYLQAAQLTAEEPPPTQAPQSQRRGKQVADLAVKLAEATHYDDLVWVRIGAFLRDVGNRALPVEVLDKPGPLTAEEMRLVRKHTEYGDALVRDLEFPPNVRPLVRSHHEHWDGTGYPDGLAGQEIPLGARILCIADVFDALTTRRSYRPAFSHQDALGIMEGEAGRIFDPRLLQQFLGLVRPGGPTVVDLPSNRMRDAV